MRNYGTASFGKWSINLDEVTKADDGNYTCVVCNALGCIQHTTTLFIQGGLYLELELNDDLSQVLEIRSRFYELLKTDKDYELFRDLMAVVNVYATHCNQFTGSLLPIHLMT